MDTAQMRRVIEAYIDAYNTFDIEAMIAHVHPDVVFQNISGDEVNATAKGLDEFQALAEQSKALFTERRQTITRFETGRDHVTVGIRYEAVLATDLPNGMKTGEKLELEGRSEFQFLDGKLYRITDYS